MDKHLLFKYIFITTGGISLMFQEISMLVVVCTLAVIIDCISAIKLAKRVKKTGKGTGKPTSAKGKKVLSTLLSIYTLIMLSYLIDMYVVTMFDVYLENVVAGIFCFWNLWSILENESSANNARWAKVLQRILVDKAERHFDVDLTEFKEKKEEI
ncbi:MAG: hypothetical protein EOM59_12730 [Clostridia bacterium]|nr:hypothetical protein [Clostridia bacterium]